MNKVNLLLCILNPREIPHFLNSIKRVDQADKLWIKYFYPEVDAYKTLRDYFLVNKQYTHLTIVPDDIIIYKSNIDYLIKDLTENDYPVLTGISNINLTDKFHDYTVSLTEKNPKRDGKSYNLLNKKTLFSDSGVSYYGYNFKVKWLGFSLTTIRRDVVEKIEFDDDSAYNEGYTRGNGCCVDTVFSYRCNQMGIDMWCNPYIKIIHLRVTDASNMTNFYANIKPRQVVLEKKPKN